MTFWGNLIGYQLVWFCAVIGAGRGMAWPGVVAALLFALWQIGISDRRGAQMKLVGIALLCGLLIDGGLGAGGRVQYAVAWPAAWLAPAWILALWVAFALTLDRSLAFLQGRPWLAALLGATGGPLAYLGAQEGFDAVLLAPPGAALAWLALAWGLALPLLAQLAQRWTQPQAASGLALTGEHR